MSFGFAVVNDLGRRVIDETHGLYVVVPARVTKSWDSYQSSGFWYERVHTIISFDRPYKSLSPPMIFMRGNGTHPSAYSSIWQYKPWVMWYYDLRYQLFGSPGNWTGARITAIHFTPGSTFLYRDRDYRSYFMVAGTAVDPVASGIGAIVRDSSGRVVFNSNDNFVVVTGYSSAWTYLGRDGGDGWYDEYWRNYGVVVPHNGWISLMPQSFYRRYNGETSEVANTNITRGGYPQVVVRGGRSGSPFHMPLMTVMTKRPLGYRYV